jgi:membrane-bound lytic murein transglycosylase A
MLERIPPLRWVPQLTAGLALLFLLGACETLPPPYVPPPAAGRVWVPPPRAGEYFDPAPATPTTISNPDFLKLPGWDQEDTLGALAGLRAGCRVARVPAFAGVCQDLARQAPGDATAARLFFETRFDIVPVEVPGLLTGYFSPEYDARLIPDSEFSAPLRARPADLVVPSAVPGASTASVNAAVGRLVSGRLEPYPDRAEIEQLGLGRPLMWLRPEDLFFLQIQGSGTAILPGGERRKLAYDGSNGRTFIGLGRIMRERGLLADNATSAEEIRQWLVRHRGPEAAALMQLNPRYVFFSVSADDGQEPVGSAGVPLPPGRAIAVDPGSTAMGGLYWIDAQAPVLTGAFPTYRRIVSALDTGGAIKGPARADLYLGKGPSAGLEAGRIRHTLKLYALRPKPNGPSALPQASALPVAPHQTLSP